MKNHYRLYKSGKRWLTVLLVTAVGGTLLTLAPGTARAADESGTSAQTTTTPTTTPTATPTTVQTTLAGLQAALTAKGWAGLTVPTQANGNEPLTTALAGVTDEASLSTAWEKVKAAVVQQEMTNLGATTAAQQNAFASTQSLVPNDTEQSNGQVISAILTQVDLSSASTPDFGATFNQLDTYFNDAKAAAEKANQPAVTPTWELNKAALKETVDSHKVTDMPIAAGNSETFGELINSITDDTSLQAAWAKVANAVAQDAVWTQMKLGDRTEENQEKFDAFMAAKSTISGHENQTNSDVIAAMIANGLPTADNPTPSFMIAIDSMLNYVDQAAPTAAISNWQVNQNMLRSIASGNEFKDLILSGTSETLGQRVDAIKSDADVVAVWTVIAQTAAANAALKQLNLGPVSETNQVQVQDFFNQPSPVSTDNGKTNGEVLADMIQASAPTSATPTPAFANELSAIQQYVVQASQQLPAWQRNKTALVTLLTSQKVEAVALPGTTQTLAEKIAAIQNDSDVNNAWETTAQLFAANVAWAKLKLGEQNDENNKKLTDFMNTPAADAGNGGTPQTNGEVLARIIAANGPTAQTPTPNFADGLAAIEKFVNQTTDWAANKIALQGVFSGESGTQLGKLPASSQGGTLIDVVNAIRDDASANTAWQTVANTLAVNEIAKRLGFTMADMSDPAISAAVEAAFNEPVQDPQYPGQTVRQVVTQLMTAASESVATPNYGNSISTITDFIDRSVKSVPTPAWVTGKKALADLLTANSLANLPASIQGETLASVVSQVADDASLNGAWSKVANAVAVNEIAKQLKLPLDTITTPTTQSAIEKFLDETSPDAGKSGQTNVQVIASMAVAAQGNFADGLKNIQQYIDQTYDQTRSDWAMSKAALMDLVTKNNHADTLVPGTNQTFANMISAIQNNEGVTQAWDTIAQMMVTANAWNTLKLGEVNPTSEAALQKFLNSTTTLSDFKGQKIGDVIAKIIKQNTPSGVPNSDELGKLMNNIAAFADQIAGDYMSQPVETPAWQTNKDSLMKLVTDNKHADTLVPGSNQTLAAMISAIQNDAGVTQAWGTIAQMLGAAQAWDELHLGDRTGMTEAAFQEFLEGTTTLPGYEGQKNDQALAAIIQKNAPTGAQTPQDFTDRVNNVLALAKQLADTQWIRPVQTPAWQTNKDNLAKMVTDNKAGDFEVPGTKQSMADMVSAIQNDAGVDQAWGAIAQMIAAADAWDKLGLGDKNDTNNLARLQAFLNDPASVPGFANQKNGEALAAIIKANGPTAGQPTPDFDAGIDAVTTFIEAAAKAYRTVNPVPGTVQIREWADGQIIGQRTQEIKNGVAANLAPGTHSGYTFNHAVVDGEIASLGSDRLTFTRSFTKADTSFTVDFFYTKNSNGGGGVVPNGNGGNVTPSGNNGGTVSLTTFTQTAERGTVYVKNPNGALLFRDAALTDQISGRVLDLASAWAFFAKVFDNQGNLIAYNLGGNQFVRASDVQETPVQRITLQDYRGIARVISETPVFSDAAMTVNTGRTLSTGSRWQIFQKVFIDGQLAGFNLGGRQFVPLAAVQEDTLAGPTGTFTVRLPAHPTWGIAVLNSSLRPLKIINAGSAWHVFGSKTLADGRTYYNLGGDQWVPTSYGIFRER